MFKLNRTTEYGLIALRHMSRKRVTDATAVTSAREVSDAYGLPFEITAKTLQRLKDTGLIASAQGARGGYTLNRPLAEVSLAEFLNLMEGPQHVVDCGEPCGYHSRCEIKGMMSNLNSRLQNLLAGIRLAEFAEGPMTRVMPLEPVAMRAAAGEEP